MRSAVCVDTRINQSNFNSAAQKVGVGCSAKDDFLVLRINCVCDFSSPSAINGVMRCAELR